MAVAVFLVGPDGRRLCFAAGCGDDIARLRSLEITTDSGTPEGAGVGGEAFRNQKLSISNDYLNDPRSLAWREGAAKAHIGAAAALPLLCNGKSVGVLYVTRREAGSLNEQMVSLFERMSANISYALDNFARETARQTSELATRRLNRMFGALSATNEAILRAKTERGIVSARVRRLGARRQVAGDLRSAERAGLALAEACRRHRRESGDRGPDPLLRRPRESLWSRHFRRGVSNPEAPCRT
ncbi:GAF domain-containing protein [Bradyrhizobium sp. i1.3.1]